jgi:hypothetical protein
MNQTQNGPERAMKQGKGERFGPRTSDDLAATDDIGMPEDARPEGARTPRGVRPDPARTQENDNQPESRGTVPLEQNQQHPTDPLKPGEADEYGTRLEKAVSKIVPPSHEVKDEDIMDPGHQTPQAPPVDNRS